MRQEMGWVIGNRFLEPLPKHFLRIFLHWMLWNRIQKETGEAIEAIVYQDKKYQCDKAGDFKEL